MIQKNRNDVLYENSREAEGPPSGLRAEGGTHKHNKKGEPLGIWLTCRPRGRHHTERKRTSFMLFDMVAELAIELARVCVTRASQLFYDIAWLC
eukprot:3005210-Amphidinium_carterae.1